MFRKPLAALAVVAAVLTVVGIALADDSAPGSTDSVAATFTAATVSDLETQTCTGSDGTYQITKASYSGDSTSSDPRLAGKVTIRVRSVYNTTKNLGWVEGKLEVDNASKKSAEGNLTAVDAGGALAGFVKGKAGDPKGKLFANVSATFDSATGFMAGQLGAGSSPDTAIVASGPCVDPHADKGPKEPKPGKAHDQGKHGKHDKGKKHHK